MRARGGVQEDLGLEKPGPTLRADVGQSRARLGKILHNKDVCQWCMETGGVDQLGLWTFLLVLSSSVPLGIAKAVRAARLRHGDHVHRAPRLRHPELRHGRGDDGVFARLVLPVFPLSGLTSMTGRRWAGSPDRDYFWHIALPSTRCRGFAVITILTKTCVERYARTMCNGARQGRDERGAVRHVFPRSYNDHDRLPAAFGGRLQRLAPHRDDVLPQGWPPFLES